LKGAMSEMYVLKHVLANKQAGEGTA
jgi:hypothetical protein